MRSVKNGKLFEDIPARSFCRSAQYALRLVKDGRGVKSAPPTGTGLLSSRPVSRVIDREMPDPWAAGGKTLAMDKNS